MRLIQGALAQSSGRATAALERYRQALALVPEGMRLVTVETDKVTGLADLRYGNSFDLVVSQPFEADVVKEAQRALKERGGSQLEQRAQLHAFEEIAADNSGKGNHNTE